jgi:hypothetical protein
VPQTLARGVRIDFEDANFDFSGQAWDPLQFVDVDGDANTTAISIGFSIDFGAGPVDTLFINENRLRHDTHRIRWRRRLARLPRRQHRRSYYSNLQSVTPTTGDQFVAQSVSYSVGQLDREAPFEDRARRPAAVCITWYDVLDSNGNPSWSGLFVCEVGTAGDFDLEFNYGSAGSDPFTAPSLAGFVLSSNSFDLSGPFGAASDYTFAFRSGVLQGATTPPPTTIPEPSALSSSLRDCCSSRSDSAAARPSPPANARRP